MHVSKRTLGEHYVVGTGVILAAFLVADLLFRSADGVPAWTGIGLVPALLLVSGVYWLPRTGLDGEQIWTVAQCGALGLGTVTLFATALLLSADLVAGAEAMTVVLASNVATGTVIGILAGLAWELHDTVERVTVRNAVLNRVLRHNVRNDMTVVIARLGELEDTLDERHQREIASIERKVESFVSLTEKVHRIDTALQERCEERQAVDVVALLREGFAPIERTHPGTVVESDVPSTAWAYADDLLGAVLTDIVENAVTVGGSEDRLRFAVDRGPVWVTVRIVDHTDTIPRQELAVVDEGIETKLNHSTGVDVWLLDWLVRDYGGELDIETTAERSVVEISLRRAHRLESSLFG
jgi:light-regulated signal transduction histidine kinase (bacteriophytochrome)